MILLVPTEMEARPIRRALPAAEVVVCGVGMASVAATTARLTSRGEALMLVGIAGAYDTTKHSIASVVEVVSEEIAELPEQFAVCYDVEPQWGIECASSNSVNRSNSPNLSAQIENMEGAAFMAICQELKIPHSQLRAISNRVGDPIEMWRIEEALDALVDQLKAILCD